MVARDGGIDWNSSQNKRRCYVNVPYWMGFSAKIDPEHPEQSTASTKIVANNPRIRVKYRRGFLGPATSADYLDGKPCQTTPEMLLERKTFALSCRQVEPQ